MKIKANKDGTITFKNRAVLNKAIREGLEKRRLEYTKEVALDASNKVSLAMLEALHLEFGFGPVRLQRFAERLYKIIDCIDNDKVNWKDLEKLYGEYIKDELSD